jgi:hypothetical protein
MGSAFHVANDHAKVNLHCNGGALIHEHPLPEILPRHFNASVQICWFAYLRSLLFSAFHPFFNGLLAGSGIAKPWESLSA